MNQLETLLERIVDQNDEVIRLLTDIKSELDWTNSIGLGKQVIDAIQSVEHAVDNVETAVQLNGD